MKKFYFFHKYAAIVATIAVGSLTLSAKTVYITQGDIRYYWDNTKSTVEVTTPEKGKTYIGDITIPASITYNDKDLKVTAVRSSAFSECMYLTSVSLPTSVTSIGNYAFDSCEKLKSVSMPGVKTIGHWSFRNCYELESWDFSEQLTTIGNYTFDKNYKITEATLPASTTNLGGFVFEGNPQLKKLTCLATTPPAIKKGQLDGDDIYTIFDDEDYGDRVLYVPEGCVNAYKTSLGWHHFSDNIVEIKSSGINDVSSVEKEFKVSQYGSGAICISSNNPVDVTIVDINGCMIKSVNVSSGSTVIDGLPAGILIVNGTKVLVR